MYRFLYESRGTGSQVSRAFPLLGLSITTLFLCIQVSIPLSLGLLGSLSIIRFRTPIKEPEEVGFIMLVIAASVAAATFNFGFIVALYLLALLSLIVTRRLRALGFLRRAGMLVVVLPDGGAASVDRVTETLKHHLASSHIESASSRDGATSLQISFSGLRTSVAALHAGLREAVPADSINVFLDRPGGLH
ncbi:MAG: DUF4956 domain-containing protein [Candidatus Schekmanbacteria bacterium]|nr:DUF4956 domain-containing protein [Candidatus Schekmanbacteria bacterium]